MSLQYDTYNNKYNSGNHHETRFYNKRISEYYKRVFNK
ncbi:hypothetical protein BMW23_0605 [Bodo saltans virus]|uniref:Uncharacterized protein n=1 Tax=Bodo saltans virus TaxID=2024608 RepID=A0A2H4UUP5_9VIRU|nr:hypothetical protein QJ851_gp0588 [Bodo saltans virus]ATZ80651.1 hypothetical protein BMW23_0605 [Bodo saltans virus]